jgi:hypothetical protein
MVACGLCCIAMSLQYLRQGINDGDLHLSATPKELIDRILAAVDQLVLSNYEYTTCLDAFLLHAKIFAESNQLLKSWLHIRKSIHTGRKSIWQVLADHRQMHWNVKGSWAVCLRRSGSCLWHWACHVLWMIT